MYMYITVDRQHFLECRMEERLVTRDQEIKEYRLCFVLCIFYVLIFVAIITFSGLKWSSIQRMKRFKGALMKLEL